MRTLCFLLAFGLSCSLSLQAKKVIGDLDFDTGNWALIGVPLHNYQQLPIQEELGTFITKDRFLFERIQQEWNLDLTFDDHCDYHYSLKFYRDGELVRTLNLNLYCGYLTYDGFSYRFAPQEFERFRAHARRIAWSRISFADLGVLKRAITTLETTDEVYWYEDVGQYQYSGFFMLSINGLPWNTDLDSLYDAVEQHIVRETDRGDFYLQRYYHLIRNDQLYIRYVVNCEQTLAMALPGELHLDWRSHLANRDSVRILAIGLDRQRYCELMRMRE